MGSSVQPLLSFAFILADAVPVFMFEQDNKFFLDFKPLGFCRQFLLLLAEEVDTPIDEFNGIESRLQMELVERGDPAEPQLPVADNGVSGEQCKGSELKRLIVVVIAALVIGVFIDDSDPTERGFKALRTDAETAEEFT